MGLGFRTAARWGDRVNAVAEGKHGQSGVRSLLGPPDMIFELGDFLHGFPLPGFVYVPYRPKGPVWVYYAPYSQREAEYVYFDKRGDVDRVEGTLEP
jgi:hypothetical protein